MRASAGGEELRVNTTTAGTQIHADVVARRDGSYVVVWGDGREIRGQRLGGDGTPVGSEFVLSSTRGRAEQPAVAASDAGNLVVAWGEGSYQDEFLVQRLDPGGAPLGGAVELTNQGGGGPDVAMAPTGEFVVAWANYSGEVYVHPFDASGESAGEGRRFLEDDGFYPAVAVASSGDFVVVWRNWLQSAVHGEIVGQRFSRGGDRIGDRFEVSAKSTESKSEPDVAMSPDGGFVVVWQADSPEAGASDVFGQRYSSAGTRVGAELQVNTYTFNDQVDPAVAISATGDFFVAWTSRPLNRGEGDVFGQLFAPTGVRVGPESRINVRGEGSQLRPAVAMGRDGALLAVWDGPSLDGGGQDVFGRRLQMASGPDADGDGVASARDNCPTVANADQADAQGDGHGDACVSPDVLLPPDLRLGANPIIGSGTTLEGGIAIGDDATIGELVKLAQQVRAGNDLQIEDFAVVGRRSTFGHGVVVGLASRIEGAVRIGDRVVIRDRVKIARSAVVEAGATLEPLVIVFAGAHVGAGATIEMGARVGRRATVLPGAVVPAGTTVPAGAVFPRAEP